MAYVAITENLKHEVRSIIDRMHGAEQLSEPPPAFDEWAFSITPRPGVDADPNPWLRKLVWGPLYGTEFERHPELTVTSTKLDARFQITDLNDRTRGRDRGDPDYQFDISASIPNASVMAHADANGYSRSYFGIRVTQDMHPAFAAFAAWHAIRTECDERWEKVTNQVIGFLESAKSLNEALKLWPDVARYIPQDALTKARAVTEKPKKQPSAALAKLAAMDLDTITSSTVLARMAGAAGSQ